MNRAGLINICSTHFFYYAASESCTTIPWHETLGKAWENGRSQVVHGVWLNFYPFLQQKCAEMVIFRCLKFRVCVSKAPRHQISAKSSSKGIP